ncbi:SDR family oxidoreductase [Verrucomicrobiales bacterium]|jgi:NADP-dependent 3-hydroxy acid dehydrogenase YdfG|nr:SDR family oxidoreductase [Verrucomicrobiales bacterium]MDB4737682.1 SDR family oxidoreductase [Verrucomicrobiales bacterium]
MDNKKLIAITGASSGIGAAIAKAFSAAGYPLLLMARRIELMEAMNLPNALCKEVDVLDLEGMKAAISEAEDAHGEVDCMINNAGVMINGKPQSQNPEDWQKMLDVNIRGVLNGIHLVLKNMVERQSGTIINMGSIAGIKTFPDHTVYCGTKFAVHAITENIREEVSGSNVRLINIAPGMVYTELLDHGCEEEARKGWMDYAEQIGGALKPDSIAQSVLFSYQMPQEVCVREIVICPTGQEP